MDVLFSGGCPIAAVSVAPLQIYHSKGVRDLNTTLMYIL